MGGELALQQQQRQRAIPRWGCKLLLLLLLLLLLALWPLSASGSVGSTAHETLKRNEAIGCGLLAQSDCVWRCMCALQTPDFHSIKHEMVAKRRIAG